MEDKVTTNQFSQLRSRKSRDQNKYLEMLLFRFRKLPISSRTVTFLDQYLGIFEVQNPSLWAARTRCSTYGSYHNFAKSFRMVMDEYRTANIQFLFNLRIFVGIKGPYPPLKACKNN